MSNQKKQIILNEIAFWKKNKMLPEKYCDYLMMMYTEGNAHEQLRGNAGEAIKAKEKSKMMRVLLLILAIAAGLVAALFYIPSVAAAAIIVGVVTFIFMLMGFTYARSKQLIATVLQLSAAIMLLALTVRISTTYFENNNTALYIGIALNCVIWGLIGWKMRLPYFTFSGILGLVALAGYWFLYM